MKNVIKFAAVGAALFASLNVAADWRGWSNGTSRGVQVEATSSEFNQFVSIGFHQHRDGKVEGSISGSAGYVPNNWGEIARSQYTITNIGDVVVIVNGHPITGTLLAGINGWSINFNSAYEAFQVAKDSTVIEVYFDGVKSVFTGKGITSEANRVGVR